MQEALGLLCYFHSCVSVEELMPRLTLSLGGVTPGIAAACVPPGWDRQGASQRLLSSLHGSSEPGQGTREGGRERFALALL